MALLVALARSNNQECNKLCLITPWFRKRTLKTYDLTDWDSSELLAIGLDVFTELEAGPLIALQWKTIYSHNNFIGHHQRKSSFASLLEKDGEISRPFQVFLLGNIGGKGEKEKLIEMGKTYRSKFIDHRAYVHAPYSLSLARHLVSTKYEGAPEVAKAAATYVKTSRRMGFKGIVFHIDKCPDPDEAMENLRYNLTELLTVATPETPIYVENSCGDGCGFLANPKDLAELVKEFPSDLVGICFDTCHGYGAGYEPLEYIKKLGSVRERIGLIHLNGAWKKKGCGRDGHAAWGASQNISFDELEGILKFARERDISCVIE